jgi:hypothetical protein
MITITPHIYVQENSAGNAEFDINVLIDEPVGYSGTTKIHLNRIPKSFWKGLADCDSGRVVDMDRAMNEPPPNVD